MQQEMNRQLEELRRKNEEEINALREENQRLRRQLEQNSQQREESHSNGEGEGDTGQDEFRVQTTTNQIGARPRTARRHPFMDGIMEVELPARWKGLTMSQYDGTTDPEEHMEVFTTQAGLYTSDDAILCRGSHDYHLTLLIVSICWSPVSAFSSPPVSHTISLLWR